MSSILDTLKADLAKLEPTRKVLIWTRWDWQYPPEPIELFKEYLTTAGALHAALIGNTSPAPNPTPEPTIRVQVTASAGLRVRSTPDSTTSNNILGKLAYQQEVLVYEHQEHSNWYKIAQGEYANGYISAAYLAVR